MITPELIILVKEEATNLKLYATKEEKSNLSFKKLDSTHIHLCIYGQMTGDCFSTRSTELLNSCTKPYSEDIIYGVIDDDEVILSKETEFGNFGRDFSPIEFYITQSDSKKDKLINFIKGKSDTLEL